MCCADPASCLCLSACVSLIELTIHLCFYSLLPNVIKQVQIVEQCQNNVPQCKIVKTRENLEKFLCRKENRENQYCDLH